MLVDKLNSIKTEKLSSVSAIALIVWIVTPVIVMILNVINLHGEYTYRVWMSSMIIVGWFGLFIGGMYIFRLLKASKRSLSKKLFALLPLLLLVSFGIWCLIAAMFAKHKLLAIFGFSFMCDCLTAYIEYFGFILLGLVLSRDKKKTIIVANTFIVVATLMALISLMDNSISARLLENTYTNCFHYEGVFYNTNHYAYYLVMNILLSGYMFRYSKNIKLKLTYIATYIIFIVTLVLNDTTGGYLASIMTIIFALIWSFINREDKKKELIILLAVFLFVSVIMSFFTTTIITNFTNMFSDAGTMLDSIDAEDVDADSVGSGRGGLWRMYWDVMKRYPIVGVGSENIGSAAHNMFLQIGAYNGFVGLGLYLSVFLVGAIRLFQKRKVLTNEQKSAAFIVVGYLISGFFGVTMFYTAPYFYIFVGVCFSAALKDLLPYEANS